MKVCCLLIPGRWAIKFFIYFTTFRSQIKNMSCSLNFLLTKPQYLTKILLCPPQTRQYTSVSASHNAKKLLHCKGNHDTTSWNTQKCFLWDTLKHISPLSIHQQYFLRWSRHIQPWFHHTPSHNLAWGFWNVKMQECTGAGVCNFWFWKIRVSSSLNCFRAISACHFLKREALIIVGCFCHLISLFPIIIFLHWTIHSRQCIHSLVQSILKPKNTNKIVVNLTTNKYIFTQFVLVKLYKLCL